MRFCVLVNPTALRPRLGLFNECYVVCHTGLLPMGLTCSNVLMWTNLLAQRSGTASGTARRFIN
jgi:hypothetical protein